MLTLTVIYIIPDTLCGCVSTDTNSENFYDYTSYVNVSVLTLTVKTSMVKQKMCIVTFVYLTHATGYTYRNYTYIDG